MGSVEDQAEKAAWTPIRVVLHNGSPMRKLLGNLTGAVFETVEGRP
jgi:hypothetical protein